MVRWRNGPDVTSISLILLLISVSVGVTCAPEESSRLEDLQLRFDEGIGLYWAADGLTNFLHYPRNVNRLSDAQIQELPPEARFFTYGLDFSTGGFQGVVPPHLLGYGVSYKPREGSRRGRWAVRFVPVEGYDVPVYEIVLPSFFTAGALESQGYEHFTLHVQDSNEGYSFRFATEEYLERRQRIREGLQERLSDSERWYEGTLSSRTLVFDPVEREFEIRFTDFDPESGTIHADARGVEEDAVFSMVGRIASDRRVILKEERSGVAWDLEVFSENLLAGEFTRGMTTYSVTISMYPRAEESAGDDDQADDTEASDGNGE